MTLDILRQRVNIEPISVSKAIERDAKRQSLGMPPALPGNHPDFVAALDKETSEFSNPNRTDCVTRREVPRHNENLQELVLLVMLECSYEPEVPPSIDR